MKSFRVLTLILLLGGVGLRGQSVNLISNGSFEILSVGPVGWTFGGLEIMRNTTAPDGTNYIGPRNYIFQNVPTVVGQPYTIRFWARGTMPTVYFGFNTVTTSPPTVGNSFVQVQATGVATHDLTLVNFVGAGAFIDDVRVIPAYTPLQILRQPESYSSFVGGSVAFTVGFEGGLPVSYQWRFHGAALAGATNASLLLTNLTAARAGLYSVAITNPAGFVVSSNAALVVEPAPDAPLLTAQPHGDTVPVGYAHTLGVTALGQAPLHYQWTCNGVELPGATNRALHFPSIETTNTGTYQVLVENQRGSALSLPARLVVTNLPGGGVVTFQHYNPEVPRPIYDADGLTLLAGSNYVAQLYAGATPLVLRPVGSLRPFQTGALAGFFANSTSTMVRLPDVPPGATAYVQTRAWDFTAGMSYEDARARGGKFGSVGVYALAAGNPLSAIRPKVPMFTFSLNAGLPIFSTGKLQVNDRLPGHAIEWKLTGAAGSIYLVEKRDPPADWGPFLVVTNLTGTVLFTDPDPNGGSARFYRARILD